MKSKFENSIVDIKRHFKGPYPLDREILRNLVPNKPGVYIWFEVKNGKTWGYVGQSISLKKRLIYWASDKNTSQVFIKNAELKELNKLEQYWILKAGDINKK